MAGAAMQQLLLLGLLLEQASYSTAIFVPASSTPVPVPAPAEAAVRAQWIVQLRSPPVAVAASEWAAAAAAPARRYTAKPASAQDPQAAAHASGLARQAADVAASVGVRGGCMSPSGPPRTVRSNNRIARALQAASQARAFYSYAFSGFLLENPSAQQLRALRADRRVTAVTRDTHRRLLTTTTPSFLRLDAPAGAWQVLGGGGSDGSGTGAGVVIGLLVSAPFAATQRLALRVALLAALSRAAA